MGAVRELALVANRSTRRGGVGDEREDEQEIFKALSLGEEESEMLTSHFVSKTSLKS